MRLCCGESYGTCRKTSVKQSFICLAPNAIYFGILQVFESFSGFGVQLVPLLSLSHFENSGKSDGAFTFPSFPPVLSRVPSGNAFRVYFRFKPCSTLVYERVFFIFRWKAIVISITPKKHRPMNGRCELFKMRSSVNL